MGLLARFFRGGLTIPNMMKMKIREIMFWYNIMEIQATTENEVNRLSYDQKTGKEKKLPSPEKIREIVDQKIKDRKNNGK